MERKHNKIDPIKVRVGDYMAMVNWVKVKEILTKGTEIVVADIDHNLSEIEVKGKALIETCFSANQFSEEVKSTKTAVAELVSTAFNRPFQVCFDKQDGTERVMYCRLIHPEPFLGRSQVVDLEITKGHNQRLVDHRTIKYLVLDGVKYTVKP